MPQAKHRRLRVLQNQEPKAATPELSYEQREELSGLMQSGPSLSPVQVLDGLDAVGAEDLRPKTQRDLSLRMDLHFHFIPSLNARRRRKQEDAFWRQVQKSGLDTIALLTHNDMFVPESGITPRSLYRELLDAMPQDVRKSDFRLLAGLEVATAENIHVGIVSNNPDIVFDEWWMGQHSAEEVCGRIASESRILGFFCHPFNRYYGAAHENGLGVDKTIELMNRFNFGIEFNGLYRESKNMLEILSKVRWLNRIGPVGSYLRDFAEADERLHGSELLRASEFTVVGGDYHDYRDLGDSSIVVKIAAGTELGSRLALRDVYDVSETDSGVTVLTTRRFVKDEFMVDAVRGDKGRYELHFPEKPETPLQFLYGASRLIREYFVGRREAKLARKEEP